VIVVRQQRLWRWGLWHVTVDSVGKAQWVWPVSSPGALEPEVCHGTKTDCDSVQYQKMHYGTDVAVLTNEEPFFKSGKLVGHASICTSKQPVCVVKSDDELMFITWGTVIFWDNSSLLQALIAKHGGESSYRIYSSIATRRL
jgi:hypothetical protein